MKLFDKLSKFPSRSTRVAAKVDPNDVRTLETLQGFPIGFVGIGVENNFLLIPPRGRHFKIQKSGKITHLNKAFQILF